MELFVVYSDDVAVALLRIIAWRPSLTSSK